MSRRRTSGDMAHIKASFDGALGKLGVRTRVREVQLQELFTEVVGEALAPMCRAVSLERGVLLVAAEHTALAHQLQLESPRLVAALNARIGADSVKRLRFTTLDMARLHDARR